jgi:peptidoglycan/LPS O-acetylase OafA/YrhL
MRFLVYTGRISYGWYLWHYPILLLGQQVFGNVTWIKCILVAAAYPMAMASYHFVEAPILRFKKRFTPSLKPPQYGGNVHGALEAPIVGMLPSEGASGPIAEADGVR